MDTLLAQDGNRIKRASAQAKAREQEKQGIMGHRNNKHHATDGLAPLPLPRAAVPIVGVVRLHLVHARLAQKAPRLSGLVLDAEHHGILAVAMRAHLRFAHVELVSREQQHLEILCSEDRCPLQGLNEQEPRKAQVFNLDGKLVLERSSIGTEPERSYLIEACKAPETLNNAKRLNQPGCKEPVCVL